MPQDYQRNKIKREHSVERKLQHNAIASQGKNGDYFELLDVGGGDGSLVSFFPICVDLVVEAYLRKWLLLPKKMRRFL